jgi:hypothetical protein
LDIKMFEPSAFRNKALFRNKAIFRNKALAALFVPFLITAPTPALAQGSAGGFIGNDDKSLSGSRPEPRSVEPDQSAHHGKPQDSEPRRTTSRSGGGGSFDGAWVVVSVGCGGSTTGAVVVSSGRIIGAGIVSGRVSPSGAASAVGNANGVRVVSSGQLSGHSGAGSFRRSDGCSGRWSASKR